MGYENVHILLILSTFWDGIGFNMELSLQGRKHFLYHVGDIVTGALIMRTIPFARKTRLQDLI